MTKADEIKTLDGILATLPDSYLRDMLRHVRTEFERDIRSDFPTMPDFATIQGEIVLAQLYLAELRDRASKAMSTTPTKAPDCGGTVKGAAGVTVRPSSIGRAGVVEVVFPAKPDEAVRNALKASALRAACVRLAYLTGEGSPSNNLASTSRPFERTPLRRTVNTSPAPLMLGVPPAVGAPARTSKR